jgi:hypothetical protein
MAIGSFIEACQAGCGAPEKTAHAAYDKGVKVLAQRDVAADSKVDEIILSRAADCGADLI